MGDGGTNRRAGGFTLLELILTISIIVLLGLLLVPKLMNATPRLAVKSEGIRFKADVAYAQQTAIAHNSPCRIVFEPGAERVLIQTYNGESYEAHRERLLGGGVDLVNTTFADNTLIFNRLGEPSEGGTITLHGSDGTAATVTVAPGTGHVSAESGGTSL